MTTKLYCGNLPYNTTEDALKEHFSQVGEVASARIVIDKMTGKSKGFGFIEMGTEDEAHAAVEKLNGGQFGGRTLRVSEARPQEDRPRTGGGGPRGAGGPRGGGGGGGRRFGGDDRGPRGGGYGGGHGGGGRRHSSEEE